MKTKYFGIAGLGVAGQSILKYYTNFYQEFVDALKHFLSIDEIDVAWQILIFDERELVERQKELAAKANATITNSWDAFVSKLDLVWFSTGFDIKRFVVDEQKIIKEVDLFQHLWQKQTIAVTGTIGKTTLTQLLYELFKVDSCDSCQDQVQGACTHLPGCSYRRAGLGGNIGVGLLDLVPHQPIFHTALLELSSWQLEQNRYFRPSLAIWMNLYENHLDRHESMDQYFQAKAMMLQYQQEGGRALLGATIIEGTNRQRFLDIRPMLKADITFIFDRLVTDEEKSFLSDQRCSYICVEEDAVVLYSYKQEKQTLCLLNFIPDVCFFDTWLFALAALFFSGCSLKMLKKNDLIEAYNRCKKASGQHRLELCAEKNGISFYNDSKSTVSCTTKAAIQQLKKQHKKVVLIMGGLNKGADRSDLLAFVQQESAIKLALRFGPGSQDLEPLPYFQDLDLVFQEALRYAEPGDAILFSPSGASFDMYENYKKRGEHFVQLVQKI